ncbi:fk506-binding protein [Anaeramoeba flamelloides]|uniref:peptidylprolyl isomerase n=1 Tax=Anaeramoeba flamelloides TaxID=1746091 RepID=A0AAV7YJ95_9EUKA|nr:fk506-binding protein [Anaeramoeba flamelloides]KAJ6248868.1 fk506-binding protein [Anaeramoeba flamelloides]
MSTENILDISKDGGITKKITKEGTGKTPSPFSKVRVHYVGHTSKGIKFDSSRDRNEPFEFVVGKGQVIKGWDLGIPTMKIGEIAVLTIKPEYGYGSQSMGEKIPANSTLVFEVELISFDDSKDWRSIKEKSVVLKDNGNQEFQKNSYSSATSQYQNSLQLIDEIPIEQLGEEDKNEVNGLKTVLNLNLAMTLIMQNEERQALDHCDQALKIEPNNAKGIYRKAICQGNLIKYDDAIKTLQAGIKFHPNNEAMIEKLKFYKKKRDAYNKKHQNNNKKKNNNQRKKNTRKKNNNQRKNNNKRKKNKKKKK